MSLNVIYALIATVGTWAVTALGAGTVVFFKKPSPKALNIMLGFAAGVMIAAAFWSLLEPAITLAENNLKIPAYSVATGGFLFGAVFMWFSDKIADYATNKAKRDNSLTDRQSKRVFLLILAITLHNIPEGLAVGVAFGALNDIKNNTEGLMGAISLAIGIGLQNFPEGAAVSLPLRGEGVSCFKSFTVGQLSGLVEPVAGIIGAALVVSIKAVLPFALSFAAGAMIIVAVHELIPECQQNNNGSYTATTGIISGFAAMMLLDVMLG